MSESQNTPGKRVRTTVQRNADLLDISRLYHQRKSVKEMVDWISANRPYKLSRSQVTADLNALLKQWHDEKIDNIHQRKVEEKALLDLVQRELFEAWEKSKKDRVNKQQTIDTEFDPKTGEPREVKQSRIYMSSQEGNPMYMQQIIQVSRERSQLFGLLAPEKKELTGADGAPLGVGQVVIELPDNGRPAYGEGEVKAAPCAVGRNGNTSGNDGE